MVLALIHLELFFSFLKGRKQKVKINNTCSVFQVLLSGVPHELILGPILFNVFTNDLLLGLKMLKYTIVLMTILFHVMKNP